MRVASEVCTDRELEAFVYHAEGRSDRDIALTLGISRWAVRDRLANATRKILHHPDYKETTHATDDS